MSHWENQENSLSAARILSDLLLLNSKSMAERKEQLAYKAIIGPLLGVVWGGYEECQIYFSGLKSRRAIGRETEPWKGPQTSVWKE